MYIREVHPADDWPVAVNAEEGVVLNQPRDWPERRAAARTCRTRLRLSIPCAVDTLDDAADSAYAAWPGRIFITDSHGTLAWVGPRGPWGLDPAATERALRAVLRAEAPQPEETQGERRTAGVVGCEGGEAPPAGMWILWRWPLGGCGKRSGGR